MNQVKVDHHWATRFVLSIVVISCVCLTHNWNHKTHKSRGISPPQEDSLVAQQDLMVKSSDESIPTRTLGYTIDDMTLWDTKFSYDKFVIQVQIDNSYSGTSKKAIEDALKSLQKRSKVIKFKTSSSPPSDKNVPYIHIQQTQEGCWSWIGRTRSANEGQVLSLDEDNFCLNSGTIQHEVLHALGFLHEHTRDDRDSHVKIHWDNIRDNGKRNFWKDKNGETLGSDYDLDSIMHYGEDTFSKNEKKTMEALNEEKIGIVDRASDEDIEMVQLLYQCRTGPRTVSEMEAEPCTPDCLCWRNKEGCNGEDSLCRGDSICQNDKCIKRPDNYPTRSPAPSTKSIIKEHNGNFYEAPGFMFDIRAKSKPISITNFYLTLEDGPTSSNIEIYTKLESHLGVSEKSNQWKKIGEFAWNGDSKYSPQILPYGSITSQTIAKWQTRAFYITSSNSSPFYVTKGSNYLKKKIPLVENSDLKILEGCSLSHIFDNKWGECKDSEGGLSYNLWGGVEYVLA